MTPTRTRTRAPKMLAGSVKEDTLCGSNDLQTNTLEGFNSKRLKGSVEAKGNHNENQCCEKSGNFENNRA